MPLLVDKTIVFVALILVQGLALAQSRAPVVGTLPSRAYEARGMENERCRQHQQRLDDAAARNGTRPFVAECMREMAEQRELERVEQQRQRVEQQRQQEETRTRTFTVTRDGRTYYCTAQGDRVNCL